MGGVAERTARCPNDERRAENFVTSGMTLRISDSTDQLIGRSFSETGDWYVNGRERRAHVPCNRDVVETSDGDFPGNCDSSFAKSA